MKCPQCGRTVENSEVRAHRYFRPLLCPNCGSLSRVVRPLSHYTALAIGGFMLGNGVIEALPFPHYLFVFGVIFAVQLGVDAWLVPQTARLIPVSPKNPAHEA